MKNTLTILQTVHKDQSRIIFSRFLYAMTTVNAINNDIINFVEQTSPGSTSSLVHYTKEKRLTVSPTVSLLFFL